MSRAIQFQEDPRCLQIWVMTARMFSADAVLVHPPRPKHGGQRLMVRKGSTFQAADMGSCPRPAAKIRAELLSLGRLKENQDGTLTLTEHIVFASPSQEANVVHGESKSGWSSWRLASHRGPSLKEVIERRDEAELFYYEKPERVVEVSREGLIRVH